MGKIMETNLKRLSLALLALGLSAPAFADNCVMVPSQQGGFKIGIDALYLRPNNSNLDYASVVSTPSATPAATAIQRNASVDPSYDWGFYAQVGYLFPCTGNDLTLGYTYLRSDESDSVDAGTFVTGVGPVVGLFPFGGTFGAAAAKAQFDLNVVDLEGGQRFTTGAYDMRMFAGVRYANIDHTLKTAAFPFVGAVVPVTNNVVFAQEYKSQFRGVGPRLGVDGRYCLNSGFGVDANLSTALLVGTVDSHYHNLAATTTGATVTTSELDSKNGSRNRVIPVLEAKLGVDYTHIIDCRCKSSIVFEAGYQVTNYFNSVDRPGTNSGVIGVTNTVNTQSDTSDISFDGPYLGVKYYA